MKYNWYLWKRKVNDGSFRFLRSDDLPSSGFCSLYAVDENTAEVLEINKNFSYFKGIVWSPVLWIDCDTEEAAETVKKDLISMNLSFRVYTTGNRGLHFAIDRDCVASPILPMQDKAWVKSNFPKSDLGVYTHLHMFRQIGATHQKTGRKKEILESYEGDYLVFDIKSPVCEVSSPSGVDKNNRAVFGSVFSDDLVMDYSAPCAAGTRHRTLATIGYRLAERKEDIEFIRRWLEHVNDLFEEPLDQKDIDKVVLNAYKYFGG